ncbi:hypothetical protein HXX76_014482 [Chlamydomonas incerta]|uniref:Uncharacterized protein n=1 Tax=Chlamydomonas incerta TaxID=51695 RepID=A0A835SLC5_CHLIN|nr:hypothetical protein HXX76_014482 [Chlamydomonas incerta]|eukprot:KAG2424429.1 hypothetical protein HXX76_014482 [Chlamydomonas incerta]
MLSPFVVLWFLVLSVSEASAATPVQVRGRGAATATVSSYLPSTLSYVVIGLILPFITGWGLAPLVWLALAGVWVAQDRLFGAART